MAGQQSKNVSMAIQETNTKVTDDTATKHREEYQEERRTARTKSCE